MRLEYLQAYNQCHTSIGQLPTAVVKRRNESRAQDESRQFLCHVKTLCPAKRYKRRPLSRLCICPPPHHPPLSCYPHCPASPLLNPSSSTHTHTHTQYASRYYASYSLSPHPRLKVVRGLTSDVLLLRVTVYSFFIVRCGTSTVKPDRAGCITATRCDTAVTQCNATGRL